MRMSILNPLSSLASLELHGSGMVLAPTSPGPYAYLMVAIRMQVLEEVKGAPLPAASAKACLDWKSVHGI